MRKQFRPLGAILLALLLSIGMAGCSMTQFNATAYVQGLLDETYKGSYDEAYLTLVGITQEEAQADYEDGLEAEYARFAETFQFDTSRVSDDLKADVIDFLGELYARARYSVGYATLSQSGAYLVEVTVQPIRYFPILISDELPAYREKFQARYANTDLTGLTAREQERARKAYEEDWAQGILDLCRGRLSLLEYGQAETIAVRLTQDDAGYYGIGDNDFYNLDALILRYT